MRNRSLFLSLSGGSFVIERANAPTRRYNHEVAQSHLILLKQVVARARLDCALMCMPGSLRPLGIQALG